MKQAPRATGGETCAARTSQRSVPHGKRGVDEPNTAFRVVTENRIAEPGAGAQATDGIEPYPAN